MDNSNVSRNNHNEHLGVNKIGKNIRKSPIHQPSFTNIARQQPQPQVYNINKNDFRDIVQQLTGSPSRDFLPRPPQNPSKPPSMRLQKIRPPPLTPINTNRPQMPIHHHRPAQVLPQPGPAAHFGNNLARPPGHFGPLSSSMMSPHFAPGEQVVSNIAESPISAYMRYLQNSMSDSGPGQNQMHPQYQHQHQFPGQNQVQSPSSGLLPNPHVPSPRMNGSPQLLPSPTSQFLLPSPGFLNMLSPGSPYPLLSPSYQFPPLTPNFLFSPMAQSGILGPRPHPPSSPGIGFPQSPSGFFPF